MAYADEYMGCAARSQDLNEVHCEVDAVAQLLRCGLVLSSRRWTPALDEECALQGVWSVLHEASGTSAYRWEFLRADF